MRVSPVTSVNFHKNRKPNLAFKSQTIYQESKIIEKDVLTLYGEKGLFTNPYKPSQEILGINLSRKDEKTIELTSRYGNKTGFITYNPNKLQPKMDVQVGSFQPIIELSDDELGLTILMTRGSTLQGNDLNIDYKEITKPNISFGANQLVVTTGYKPEKTKAVVDEYLKSSKSAKVERSEYADLLKQDYTIVGLGGGYGSRLKPISDLEDDNKLSTKFPGGEKSLFEVSVLDVAARVGNIDNVKFIEDDPNNLTGTAGPIIKGLNNGTIPLDKPLVLLTGDTFNNIDLAKALYDFEKDSNSGMAMVVKNLAQDEILGNSLVKFKNSIIGDFSPIINNVNHYRKDYYESLNGFYAGTNITIVSPKILNILKDFADKNGDADFVEFLGLMFNTLNKSENLETKYPNGLKSEKLGLSDLTNYDKTPKEIKSDNGEGLYLKVVVAKDINGNTPHWSDVGTIEDYIKIAQVSSKEKNITGFSKDSADIVKTHVDDNGVIYINADAKDKVEKFKKKYNINEIKGNVIVHSKNVGPQKIKLKVLSSPNELFELVKDEKTSQIFINDLMKNPQGLRSKSQEMISKYGVSNFINWYMSPNGYYGAYEKYVENLFENSKSLDELIKFSPNWAPWKLEEKQWLLENNYISNYSKEYKKRSFDTYMNDKREQAFQIGVLPSIFASKNDFNNLINILKNQEIIDENINLNGSFLNLKRLKGGELNDKFIYLLKQSDKKFILKLDRINIEDATTLNGRNLSLFEKKSVRKNKHIASDSIYSNACISRYLELNGCDEIPKLHYYDYTNNAAIYEYVEDLNEDLFQKGRLDEEYDSLENINDAANGLNKLGIFLNDSAYKNILKNKEGKNKIIDLGHSNFIMPFKLGVKHYNIEFSNTNGPDFGNIYAGILINLKND